MKTRIQVSIHPDLVAIAERRMKERTFSSFSSYLETLIREEHERRQPPAAPSSTAATLADQIVSDAVAVVAAPAPGPISYAKAPPDPRRSAAKRASSSRKK
jgi:hypothetical protein